MYDRTVYSPTGLFQKSWLLQMSSTVPQSLTPKKQTTNYKKNKKCVQFHPRVNVISDGSETPTVEEKKAAWYGPSDFKEFKKDIRATLKLLQQQKSQQQQVSLLSSNDDASAAASNDTAVVTTNPALEPSPQTPIIFDEDTHCSWGIARGSTTIQERQMRKKQAVKAVMMEQMTQKMELEGFQLAGIVDDPEHPQLSKLFEYDDDAIALVYKGCVSNSVEEAYYLGLQMSNEIESYRSTGHIGGVGCSSVVVNFCSLLAQEHKVMGRVRRSSIRQQRPPARPQRSASNQMITATTFLKSFAGISMTLLEL